MDRTDQRAYMHMAIELKNSSYSATLGRNRMPIYPFIQSLFYESGANDDQYFPIAKRVNIFLSLIVCGILLCIFIRHLPRHLALNLFAISSFTVILFRAAYVQCEVLYYFLSFIFFLLALSNFEQPTKISASLTGVLAGLAYLTKASLLPGLFLFLFFFIFSNWRKNIIPGILTILCFLVVVSPYIITSKRVMGQYFYNVNSNFYMWSDSWPEAVAATGSPSDEIKFPQVTEEALPGPSKYFREHTMYQAIARVNAGLQTLWKRIYYSYGYSKYIGLYLLTLLILVALNWSHFIDILKKHLATTLFVAAYLLAYALLYAWYVPIVSGIRLALSLFLPLMFIIFVLLKKLNENKDSQSQRILLLMNWGITLILIIDIYGILTRKILLMAGDV